MHWGAYLCPTRDKQDKADCSLLKNHYQQVEDTLTNPGSSLWRVTWKKQDIASDTGQEGTALQRNCLVSDTRVDQRDKEKVPILQILQ